MRIISIAFKDLLITIKDKKAMAMIVLMPIVLIFVLGMALSSMFSGGGGAIKQFDVALVNKDGGEYAESFKEFLNSEDIKKMVNVIEMDYAEAETKVKKGEIPALILLPEDYSRSVKEGIQAKIQIYKDPGSELKGQVIEGLVKSYTSVGSSVKGAVAAADSVFKEYNLDSSMMIPQVMKVVNDSTTSELKESKEENLQNISSMQYYSAAMLVMYILFVGMLGTASIIEEREQKTLLRLMGTTVSKTTILTGKLLGLFILGVLDVSVLILFTKFIFKVNWGSSTLGIIILSAAMIFAASGFAMFIAALFKSSKAVDSATPAIVMIMSFMGGSMFPLMAMPSILQNISKITLNNWALRGYISLMTDGTISSIITPTLVLGAIGIIFLTVGISRLKLQ